MTTDETITAFLAARLDEDEEAAREETSGPWRLSSAQADRLLAEVKAKRQIIELAGIASGLDMQVDGEFAIGIRDEQADPYVGNLILRHLAAPYADHPDYRTEWRP